MKFTKCSGGWKYISDCGNFEIVNLSKCDGLEDAKKSGWQLFDVKNDEYIGRYKTLKEAIAAS